MAPEALKSAQRIFCTRIVVYYGSASALELARTCSLWDQRYQRTKLMYSFNISGKLTRNILTMFLPYIVSPLVLQLQTLTLFSTSSKPSRISSILISTAPPNFITPKLAKRHLKAPPNNSKNFLIQTRIQIYTQNFFTTIKTLFPNTFNSTTLNPLNSGNSTHLFY